MSSKPRMLSVLEAAGRLGVAPKTVRKWVRSGRLKGQVTAVTITREIITADADSLKKATVATCALCGKKFTSRRSPPGRFCSPNHRHQYRHDQVYEKLLLRPKPKARAS